MCAPNGGVGFRLGLDYFKHQRTGPEMTWRDSENDARAGAIVFRAAREMLGPARARMSRSSSAIVISRPACRRGWKRCCSSTWLNGARTKQKALCLAGGVAFNCVANGKMLERTPFERIYVQPAAGDAGLSVGAAFASITRFLAGRARSSWSMPAGGRDFRECRSSVRLTSALRVSEGIEIQELNEDAVVDAAARELADGKILGWFQGRAEWGPRALGNRSILADPRRAGHEGHPQSADQTSRNVSALRALNSGRSHRRILRAHPSLPLHDVCVSRAPRETAPLSQRPLTSTGRRGSRRSAAEQTRSTGN